MTRIPKLAVVYAYDTPYGHGPHWESVEEAFDQDSKDAGSKLYRLFVDEQGRVVHHEEVDA